MKTNHQTHVSSNNATALPMKGIHVIFAAAILAFSLPSSSIAATSTFTGAGSNGNWNTTDNWSPVPSDGDDIIIADTTGQNNLVMNSGHSVGNLMLGDTGTRINAFTISSDGNLILSNGLVAAGNFSTIGLTFIVPVTIGAAQTWTVGGIVGNANTSAGVQVNNAVSGTQRTFTLNGTLTKDGTGQLGFTGLNIGNGNIQVNSGSLKLNAANGTRLTVGGTGTITVGNGASLIFSQSTSPATSTFTVSKAISFQDGSTLQVGGAAAFNSANSSITSGISLANNAHITLNALKTPGNVDTSFVFNSTWSGGTDSILEKTGTATVTFSGATTSAFSTLLKISEGILILNSSTTDGGWRGPVEVASGATLKSALANQINNGASVTVNGLWDAGSVRDIIGTLSGNGTVTNAGQNANNALWISTTTNSTFSGVLSGNSLGSLTGATNTQTFTGTVSVTNLIVNGVTTGGIKFSGNAIANATNVSGTGGLLTITDNAKLTVGAGGISTNGGGYVVLGGGTGAATLAASATSTSAGNIQLVDGSGGSPVFDTTAHTMTMSGVISGAGGLTKIGAGTLVSSGVNTYTGNTSVNEGVFTLISTSELRFVIDDAGVSNSVLGTGTVNLNGVFRLNISGLTDTTGTWNLVNVGTLTEIFDTSFGVKFLDDTSFTNIGGGLYTSGDWTFSTITGNLTLVPEPSVVLLTGFGLFAVFMTRRRSRRLA